MQSGRTLLAKIFGDVGAAPESEGTAPGDAESDGLADASGACEADAAGKDEKTAEPDATPPATEQVCQRESNAARLPLARSPLVATPGLLVPLT